MKYVLFLSEDALVSQVLYDDRDLLRMYRTGRIRREDEIYLPETDRTFTARELIQLLRKGHKETLRVPATLPVSSSPRMPEPAAPISASASPAVPIPLREVAAVSSQEYYQAADLIVESYAGQYKAIERDIVLGLACLPLFGYGLPRLWRALGQRAQIRRRLNQACLTERALQTAIARDRAFYNDYRQLRAIAALSNALMLVIVLVLTGVY